MFRQSHPPEQYAKVHYGSPPEWSSITSRLIHGHDFAFYVFFGAVFMACFFFNATDPNRILQAMFVEPSFCRSLSHQQLMFSPVTVCQTLRF